MTTVVDALIVTLGLDAKGFNKGRDQARQDLRKTADEAGRAAKEIEERGKQAAQFFTKVRNEALSLFAVFTAGMGMKNFAMHTIQTASGLDRLSKTLNMSVKDLAEWQLANRHAGGTIEGMTAQLQKAQQEVENYKAGFGASSEMQAAFNLGITEKDLKNGETYLLGLSQKISELYKKNPATALFAARRAGMSDDTFQLFKDGPEKVQEHRREQAKLADEYARTAQEAEKLRQKLDTLTTNFEAVGVKIMTRLMPHLERFSDWVIANDDKITKFVDTLANDVERVAKQADKAAEAMGGWTNVLLLFAGVKLASIVAEIWGAVSAFRALAAAKAALTAGAAAGAAEGAAGAGAAAGGGFLAKAFPWLARAGVFAGLMLHSGGLNEGEDAELARRRGALGNGDPKAMFSSLEEKYHLPAGILDSIWLQESSRGKRMRSPKGAKGHFGFMDATAKQYGLADPNDLPSSADAAARMLGDLLRKYHGDASLALAGYNWGQGNVDRLGLGHAGPETQNYIAQVLGRIAPPALAASTRQPAGNTSTAEVVIQNLQIYTQATDAQGIAKDLSADLQRNLMPLLKMRGGD